MNAINIKNPWKLAVFAILTIFLVFMAFRPVASRAALADSGTLAGQAELRTISVTGSADVMVEPDEVDITVGVETRNVDFDKAKADNEKNAKLVIEVTKKHGIDPKNVQSDYIRTFPSYDYGKYGETVNVTHYTVQKRIIVKLNDIGKFEALVSDLMDNGSVLIQDIRFKSTKLWEYKNEARKLAMKAAKDKAVLLAGELGAGIAKPITISEEQITDSSWYGSWWSGSWYGYGQPAGLSNVAVNYQDPGSSSDAGETIAIGQIRITAKIGVVFEIK